MVSLRMHPFTWIFFLFLFIAGVGETKDCIHAVKVSPSYFNPHLNEKIELSFDSCASGSLTVRVIDRDGYFVCYLADARKIEAGPVKLIWDGKYSDAQIAPDEAYSFKIDLNNEKTAYTYFPANNAAEHLHIVPQGYNRRDGFLQYVLPKAARVHVQAGTAVVDPNTKEVQGPVLKTIASRLPRAAGTVLESWDGRDESGTIFVPDLQDFALAVAAMSLPENSVIVHSNTSGKFVDRALKRNTESLLAKTSPGPHHVGLSAIQDQIPEIEFKPVNGSYIQSEGLWQPQGPQLQVEFLLKGVTLPFFLEQPGDIFIYIDKVTVKKITPLQIHSNVTINLNNLSEGNHVVSINAASHYGPTAANAFMIRIDSVSRVSWRNTNVSN